MNAEYLEKFFSKVGCNLIELVKNINKCRKKVVKFDPDNGTGCPVWACQHFPCKVIKVYSAIEGTRKRRHCCQKCSTEFFSMEILPPKPGKMSNGQKS